MGNHALALLGAAGGVGTTRLSIEAGAALALDGDDAIVVDTAVATQGLAAYLPGRIDPDLTELLIDDHDLDTAVHDHPVELPGRFGVCPAYAPFTRLAEVQTPDVAKRLSTVVEDATDRGDTVILDVPPLASNLAVAAVTAADRLGVVTEPTDRGRDALSRCRGRLADIGTEAGFVVGNRIDETEFADADVRIPESRVQDIPETPTVIEGEDGFGPGIASLLEVGVDTDLGVSLRSDWLGTAREYLS